MSNSYPISTPALPNEHLVKLSSPEVDAKSYQCALSSLMYPMLGTRPDLGYTITALGHHAANPGPNHQCTLERVFHYLSVILPLPPIANNSKSYLILSYQSGYLSLYLIDDYLFLT